MSRKECRICRLPKDAIQNRPKRARCYPEDPEGCSGPNFLLCGHCDVIIEGEEDLEHHIQNIHLGANTYKCRQCWTLKSKLQFDVLDKYLITDHVHLIKEYIYGIPQYNKLCEMLNMSNEGFKELTDIAFIAGDTVAYVLNKSIPKLEGWDISLMKCQKKVDIYILANKGASCREIETNKRKIANILRREMRYVSETGFGSGGTGGQFYVDVINSSNIFSSYPGLPWMDINVITDNCTPEELVQKFYLEHQECLFHKGNFWISDKAKLAFETKLTGYRKTDSNYWHAECESSAKRMGMTLIER